LVTDLTVPVLLWLMEPGKSPRPLEEGQEREANGNGQAEKEGTDDDTPMSNLLALHRSADGKSKRSETIWSVNADGKLKRSYLVC
jgi:hypothetical protein